MFGFGGTWSDHNPASNEFNENGRCMQQRNERTRSRTSRHTFDAFLSYTHSHCVCVERCKHLRLLLSPSLTQCPRASASCLQFAFIDRIVHSTKKQQEHTAMAAEPDKTHTAHSLWSYIITWFVISIYLLLSAASMRRNFLVCIIISANRFTW